MTPRLLRPARLAVLAAALACAPAAAEDADPGFAVLDVFGRDVTRRGLVLVDWDGYMANPAVAFSIVPPSDAKFPVQALLQSATTRLCFDEPSKMSRQGPMKVVGWDSAHPAPVHVSIFPDRDGLDEDHVLTIGLVDAGDRRWTTAVRVHVVDQDVETPDAFEVHVDFTQDMTRFFADAAHRRTLERAARDWAHFFDDMKLDEVPAGEETTPIWEENGFVQERHVRSELPFKGFLLYAYGIHGDELRSGGASSAVGGYQTSGGKELPLRRSGEVAVEIRGNYSKAGWIDELRDEDWWKATNSAGAPCDLYSIVHHEIGHALVFHTGHSNICRVALIGDARLAAYLGSLPYVDATDHLAFQVDPESLRGAFGNEYHGRMPLGRWLITKTDLLCAAYAGYAVRLTSAFAPLVVGDDAPPPATRGKPYAATLTARGGVPGYEWSVVAGSLPNGLTLDSFTGEIRGSAAAAGASEFTVRVRDGSGKDPGATRPLRLEVRAE